MKIIKQYLLFKIVVAVKSDFSFGCFDLTPEVYSFKIDMISPSPKVASYNNWYEYSKWPCKNIGTNIDGSEMSQYEYRKYGMVWYEYRKWPCQKFPSPHPNL